MAREETVLAFVRDSIRSAWSLELLLALQHQPERQWSVAELVHELRGSTQSVQESAATLVAAGLVASRETGDYRYQPRTPEAAELVAALVELYRQKPLAVLRAIFSSPSNKIRSFADAFRFKKSDNEP